MFPKDFSFGIKGGVGFCKLADLSDCLQPDQQPNVSYPLGYSVGLFIENKFFYSFSMVNELNFQNSIFQQKVYTGYEGIVDQKIKFQYLTISALFKYQTLFLADTYFYMGPTLSYLIISEYNFNDRIYLESGEVNIKKDLPSLFTTLELGIGEKFNICNSSILLEIKAQLELTRFKYKKRVAIGKWNNRGLMFLLGYQIN